MSTSRSPASCSVLADTATSALLFVTTIVAYACTEYLLSGRDDHRTVEYAGIEREASPTVTWGQALEIVADTTEDEEEEDAVLVDTRTPAEFARAHVYGAVNIPLMNDTERHVIGKTYHHAGTSAAIALGWRLFRPLVGTYLRRFERYRGRRRRILVYCWRGGMRSRIVTNLLLRAGHEDAVQITGGYKRYLNQIVWKGLEGFAAEYRPRFIVLFGYTGTGKTAILQRLQQRGLPVVDLEGLAGHRSSVYGAVDLQQSSQKMFSITLYHRLLAYQHEPFIFLEGEAHKVGDVHLPTFLQGRIADDSGNTVKVLVKASMATRVAYLKDDYLQHGAESVRQIRQATEMVRKYVGNKNADYLQSLLDQKDYDTFTEWLLVNHYDTGYRFHKKGHEYALTVESDDLDACCDRLEQFHREMCDKEKTDVD